MKTLFGDEDYVHINLEKYPNYMVVFSVALTCFVIFLFTTCIIF